MSVYPSSREDREAPKESNDLGMLCSPGTSFFPVGFAAVSSQVLRHHKRAFAEASKQPIKTLYKELCETVGIAKM